MTRQMPALDDDIKIEVVRKEEEEVEPREVTVYFECEHQEPNSRMSVLQYDKLFNWSDALNGDCGELVNSLKRVYNITLENPKWSCSPIAPSWYIRVTDNTHDIYFMEEDNSIAPGILLKIDQEVYELLYTGKVVGYNDLDIFHLRDERFVRLPTHVDLLLDQKPRFGIYSEWGPDIEFRLGVTTEGAIDCESIWETSKGCDGAKAQMIKIADHTVSINLEPTRITSERMIEVLQERGKIDVAKLPTSLAQGACGWIWRGDETTPSDSLSADTKLWYYVGWTWKDKKIPPAFRYSVDLAYGNPPSSTDAINLYYACESSLPSLAGEGTLPCAPIIRAALDELPIVDEKGDFLTDCFSGDEVICDKDILHKYLLDLTVSKAWWDLTDARRRALGQRVIEEFGAFTATRYAIGNPNCLGTNIGSLYAAVCGENAIIKSCKINTCELTNHYYYKDYYGSVDQAGLRHCYTEEEYNLPCYYTEIAKNDHAIAALQVGEDGSDWDSWIFFQYNDTSIQPGSWQMPVDDSLEIYEFGTGFMGLPGGPPLFTFYLPSTGKPSPILRGNWIYVRDPVWLTKECCSVQYKVYSEEGVSYVGVAEANGIEEEGVEVFGSSCTSEGLVKLLTSKFPPGAKVNINLKRVDNKAETLDTKIITIPIEFPTLDWICPICGFKCDTCFDLDGHIQDEHTPGIYTLPNWAIDTRYCYECGMNFIGGTDEENKTAYQAHQDEFLYRHTQREVKETLIGMGRESELPIYWLDPPTSPGYVNVIPTGYYIYIDRQYVGDSPKRAFCGPNREHEIRLIDTSNTILLDEDFTVGEGEVINIGGELPDIILDIPTPAPLPPGTCRVVISTQGYTATVEGHSYISPLEFFIPIEAEGHGPFTVASGVVKLTWDNLISDGTLTLFKLHRDLVWALDKLRTTPTLMNQLYDYIPTEDGVTLVMKPTVTIPGPSYVDGTIDIPASDIPTALYQQTLSKFDMMIINTGTVKAEYQVAITFEGIDVANEEVFWSGWSGEVAPNESTVLPVLVKLSEEAIPIGAETAEYNILTKLIAR